MRVVGVGVRLGCEVLGLCIDEGAEQGEGRDDLVVLLNMEYRGRDHGRETFTK